MKIAVLGAAPSSRLLAPFNDLSWEIWACSPPNYDLPRVDAWFEVHSLERKFSMAGNQPWVQKLKQHPRVYVNAVDPLRKDHLPLSVPYPIEKMVAKYGRWFFTSSLAYMLAMAIDYKPEVIGLWGVDMSASEEYGYQRAGCHFFIREAAALGIQVVAPPQSDILCPVPLYGFKEQSPMFWKQKVGRKELRERVARCENQIAQADNEMKVLRGAMDDMNYIENTYDPLKYSDFDIKPYVEPVAEVKE
jgi:hypothetical protein